jgi:hypothetical protein
MNTTNTNSNLLSYPVHWLLWETPKIIQIRDVNGYAGAAGHSMIQQQQNDNGFL